MSNYDGLSDEDKQKMLDLIEDSWHRLGRAPKVSNWRPPHDETNPGSFKPQDQSLHALPSVDQTKTVSRLPGGRVESDGQFQFENKHPKDMGVTNVQGSKQMLGQYDGQFHSKNLKPLDQGVTSSHVNSPPTHDVHVADQNLHVAPLSKTAALPPLAVEVKPGAGRPGSGVPSTVHIK